MFGIGAPEFIVLFVIIIIIAIFMKVIKVSKLTGDENIRRCLQCNYQGPMKTWLRNYGLPQFIAIVGLLFYVIPGLIFIGWAWNKRKCPNCGALAKNAPLQLAQEQAKNSETKKCPFCAEMIKVEAVKCKHCGSNI